MNNLSIDLLQRLLKGLGQLSRLLRLQPEGCSDLRIASQVEEYNTIPFMNRMAKRVMNVTEETV
jgi:hypothetical protein